MSLLAIDIGSSRIKASLGTLDGGVVASRHVSTPRHADAAGERSYPMAAVQDAIEGLTRNLVASCRDDAIDTIAFSCLGTAMVPLDRSGAPLGPALAPADARPMAGPDLIERTGLAAEELRRATGSDPRVASSLLHLLWWQRTHPDVVARATRWRSLRGSIVQEWCGADAEDPTWASRTMLFDLEAQQWSRAIVETAGLDVDVLPPLAPPSSLLAIREPTRRRLGLAPGAHVVLGAMDNCCAFLGATLPHAPALVNIVGSYEHMAGTSDLATVRVVAGISGAVVHRYLQPEEYIVMTRVAVGELLSHLVATGGDTLDVMLRRVSSEPSGVSIPLRASAIDEALEAGMSPTDVLRGVLEASTEVLRVFVDAWPREEQAARLVVAGGGSAQDRVLQLKATLLGRTLSRLADAQAASIGALRLAAMVRGGLSVAEACRVFPNPIERAFEPVTGGGEMSKHERGQA